MPASARRVLAAGAVLPVLLLLAAPAWADDTDPSTPASQAVTTPTQAPASAPATVATQPTLAAVPTLHEALPTTKASTAASAKATRAALSASTSVHTSAHYVAPATHYAVANTGSGSGVTNYAPVGAPVSLPGPSDLAATTPAANATGGTASASPAAGGTAVAAKQDRQLGTLSLNKVLGLAALGAAGLAVFGGLGIWLTRKRIQPAGRTGKDWS
jgi:hypothetical protein